MGTAVLIWLNCVIILIACGALMRYQYGPRAENGPASSFRHWLYNKYLG